MGFTFLNVGAFELPTIKKQFDNFLECSEDSLPVCSVRFLEYREGLFSERKHIKSCGGHSFYLSDGGILIDNSTCLAFVSGTFDSMDVYIPENGRFMEVQLSRLMLHAYRYILVHSGNFQMHSAVVVKNGVGIAFCGTPGAGKSTQAHLWEEYQNAVALNLDQPCVLLKEDSVLVSGSPWSGKEDCYKTDVAPLRAIFFVEQAKENTVENLSAAEAFSHLYLHNYLMPVNDEFDELYQKAVLRVASDVSVYRLKCTISKDAVDAAYNAVFG